MRKTLDFPVRGGRDSEWWQRNSASRSASVRALRIRAGAHDAKVHGEIGWNPGHYGAPHRAAGITRHQAVRGST